MKFLRILALIILILALFAAGFGTNYYLSLQKPTYEQGYQKAMDYAHERIAKKSPFPVNSNIARGIIVSADASGAVFTYDASDFDWLQEGTIAKKLTLAAGGVFQSRKLKENLTPPSKPEDFATFFPYEIQDISFKDLKAGDIIQIQSEKEIAAQDPVEANQIILQGK
ncbi:hypothetical protein HZA43_02710 [Candidatus Peregrinibacteria bacterium]|nr:hypothetical protein [Candidatus Peregrinibacteria bacterium]